MTLVPDQKRTSRNASEWKPFFGAAILYVAGHFLLLFNRGFYWDGVYQSRMLLDGRLDVLWANLEPSRVYAYYFLLKLLSFSSHPIFLFKFCVFLSWLVAGAAVYCIARKRLALSQSGAFFITASFLLVPAFLARVELSTFPYSLSSMLFFVAALLYFMAEKSGGSFARRAGFVGAWLLFFLSFFTYSLLVFYGAFLLFLLSEAYMKREKSVPLFSWGLTWIRSHAFFVLLPLIFWVFKLSLGAPYGPALHYNENDFIFLHSNFLSALAEGMWNSFTFGFWTVVSPLSILQRRIFALVFLAAAALVFLVAKKSVGASRSAESALRPEAGDRSPRWFFVSGVILCFFGALAYILVGKSPHVWGVLFATRHALLFPLGLSFILFAAIRALVQERFQKYVRTIVLALFITFNIYNYWSFDMDWYRSLALTENLRTTANKEILSASTLIFHDHLPDLRYLGRNMSGDNYRTYVYEAFPAHFKFAILPDDLSRVSLKEGIRAQYDVAKSWSILPFPSEFDPALKPVHVVVVSKAGRETMTVYDWLRLKRYELSLDDAAFARFAAHDLRVEVIPTQTPEALFD